MDINNRYPHAFIEPPNPLDDPHSMVQVDVVDRQSECLVFIRSIEPRYLPLCIRNNTLDVMVTICQEFASFDTAVTIAPLTSRMTALPVIENQPAIMVFARIAGASTSPYFYRSAFSTAVTTPGVLGEFPVQYEREWVTVKVSLIIHQSTRILVFEKGRRPNPENTMPMNMPMNISGQERMNSKDRALMYGEQTAQQVALLTRHSAIREMLHSLDLSFQKQVAALSIPPALYPPPLPPLPPSLSSAPPSAPAVLSTDPMVLLCLQCVYADTCTTSNPQRYRVTVQVNQQYFATFETEGVVGALTQRLILPPTVHAVFHVQRQTSPGIWTSAMGVLSIAQFATSAQLHTVCIPCFTPDGFWLCQVRVLLSPSSYADLASVLFERRQLELLETEMTGILDRVPAEFRRLRGVGEASKAEYYLASALRSGQVSSSFRELTQPTSPSSPLPPSPSTVLSDNRIQAERLREQNEWRQMESLSHFAVTIHTLSHVPGLFHHTHGLYALLTIGPTTLRTPVCRNALPDPGLNPPSSSTSTVTISVHRSHPDFSLMPVLQEETGTTGLIVCSLARQSLAFAAGLRIGYQLMRLNDHDAPTSLEELESQLQSSNGRNTLVFGLPPSSSSLSSSPCPSSFFQLAFNQELLFPAGVTLQASTFTIHVFEETDLMEDLLVFSHTLPISRGYDSHQIERVGEGYELWYETCWQPPELTVKEVAMFSLQVDVSGVGISLVDALPRELAYLSVNALRSGLAITEAGKVVCEMKV